MLAVIKVGGVQHIIKENDIITVNKLNANIGEEFIIEDVLSIVSENGTQIGNPTIEGSKVTGIVLEQTKGKKVIVFKKKRRHNYRRKKGHRQHLTKLKIVSIA